MSARLTRTGHGAALVALALALSALGPGGAQGQEPPRRERTRLIPKSERPDIFTRAEEHRPAEQRIYMLFGRPLRVGGELELRSRLEVDYRLEDGAADNELQMRPKLELETSYQISERTYAYLEGKLFVRSIVYEEGTSGSSSEGFVERGEMWLYSGQMFGSPLSLQVGRQRFHERREWFWDEDLDAIRLHFDAGRLHLEGAIAERVAQISTRDDHMDPEQRNVLRLLSRADFEWADDHHFELFALHQRDTSNSHFEGEVLRSAERDESDADLTWLGVGLRGELEIDRVGEFEYWLDGATVNGDEAFTDYDVAPGGLRLVDTITDHDVRGWGFDAGATWRTSWPLRPSFTAGYARGSGDTGMIDDTDSGFRQPGLQDNNGKWYGVNRFRYYGELLRPELSNLVVTTLSLGLPILRSSSVELTYHRYRQDHRSNFLRDAELQRDPDGTSRDIGDELDVAIGLEEWTHLEIELIGAVFDAGSAFGSPDEDRAYFAELKVKYNF